MAKEIEIRCVGCELPCLGSACPNSKEVITYSCDECNEKDEIFMYGDQYLCIKHLLKQLKNDGIIEVVE